MFKPTAKSFWKGNIKKYGIATTNNGAIKVGNVLDANGNLAMDAEGQIEDTAQSYWSLAPDGEDVEEGGVGEVLQTRMKNKITRNIYTYLGSNTTLTDVSNVFDVSNSAITTTMLDLNLNDSGGREKVINFVRVSTPTMRTGMGTTGNREIGPSEPLSTQGRHYPLRRYKISDLCRRQ